MMNGSNYSLSDIAAATGSNNRANDMWGGDGLLFNSFILNQKNPQN